VWEPIGNTDIGFEVPLTARPTPPGCRTCSDCPVYPALEAGSGIP